MLFLEASEDPRTEGPKDGKPEDGGLGGTEVRSPEDPRGESMENGRLARDLEPGFRSPISRFSGLWPSGPRAAYFFL